MDIYTTSPVRISRYHKVFQDTVTWYRNAVDFFIRVILSEEDLFILKNQTERVNAVERLIRHFRKTSRGKVRFREGFLQVSGLLPQGCHRGSPRLCLILPLQDEELGSRRHKDTRKETFHAQGRLYHPGPVPEELLHP